MRIELGELGQLLVAEVLARIEPARPELGGRHQALLALRRQASLPLHRLSDQRGKPAPERLFGSGAFIGVSSAVSADLKPALVLAFRAR